MVLRSRGKLNSGYLKRPLQPEIFSLEKNRSALDTNGALICILSDPQKMRCAVCLMYGPERTSMIKEMLNPQL